MMDGWMDDTLAISTLGLNKVALLERLAAIE